MKRARTGSLYYFITYGLDNEIGCERDTFEVIINDMLFACLYISAGKEKSISLDDFFNSAWLFFDIIIKSIAISLDHSGAVSRNKFNLFFYLFD